MNCKACGKHLDIEESEIGVCFDCLEQRQLREQLYEEYQERQMDERRIKE